MVRVLFVIGGPGAGKGTQCELLVQKYNLNAISAGDMLRAEVKKGSELGQYINGLISQGQLVPGEVTVGLLKAEMQRLEGQGQTNFLIDGFPRSQSNIDNWNAVMESYCTVVGLINLNCPFEVLKARLCRRGSACIHTQIYSYVYTLNGVE